jgi:hypothetical protein
MSYQYDISPITKTKKIIYCKYQILIDRLYFGENKADIRVILADETEENIKEYYYLISGTDYLEWTTDNYLVNWVKNKLRNENL